MSEEHGPHALVKNAQLAEKAGFDLVAISDHYHPWLRDQGHSPSAWSVLGAIAAKTERLHITTAVTCPFLRYHPAIIAQAGATISILSNGRFTLGLGSGELLNEHIVGLKWPAPRIRHEMLSESIDIIRLLWKGGIQSYRGRHITLDRACVFDLPEKIPPIIVAAGGTAAVKLAARKADGIIATQANPDLIDTWLKTGASNKAPRYCEIPLCWASDEKKAIDIAHKFFSWALSGWGVLSELPNMSNFEAASKNVQRDDIAEKITCGPDPERHLQTIREYIDAGFDHLILLGIGPDQEGFIHFWENELAPKLR